jgi:hypothetical protein
MNRDILKKIYTERKAIDGWLDSIPKEICAVFYDNPVIESEYKINAMLIKELYKEHAEEVSWLLYEWKSGSVIKYKDIEYALYTIDQAITSIFNPELLADIMTQN